MFNKYLLNGKESGGREGESIFAGRIQTSAKLASSCQHWTKFCLDYHQTCAGGYEYSTKGEKPQPDLKLRILFPQKMVRKTVSTTWLRDVRSWELKRNQASLFSL